jgi:hypothetical protein
MATKRNRKSTAQASKPRTPKEEAAQQPINGVLVQLVETEDGQQLNVQALGSVKVTEAPTLLRLAAQNAEKQLGL